MKWFIGFWIWSVSAFLSFSVIAQPVAWQSEEGVGSAEWFTQSSEHFVIHFQKEQQLLAAKSLDIAEQEHADLIKFFDYEPENKTQMVIVDDHDFSNGWATFFPFAQIRLFSQPPTEVNSLENIDDWLHLLIRHEYVHILHMESGEGDNELFRDIFGRLFVFFPHALTPSFMLEGLAVYLETDEELGYGRSQNSFYSMQMRAEIQADNLKDLNEVILPLRRWPLGANYLYGSYFHEYLAAAYGEEKIKKFITYYRRELIPYFHINSKSRAVFGKSFTQMWPEFQDWLKNKYGLQIQDLEKEQQASSQSGSINDINEMPNYGMVASTSSDQNGYFYIENNGEDRPELRQVDSNGKQKSIVDVRNILDMDIDDQGKIVATQTLAYVDGHVSSDIYLLEDDEWEKLTHRKRYKKVRWFDQQWLLATRVVAGISELVLLDMFTKYEKTIWQFGSEETILGQFDISHDKQWLVAMVKRPHQGWNLERLSLTNIFGDTFADDWEKITNTKSVENSPAFINDGSIIYSADYDGVFNIFKINPDTGETVKLTDVVTGAFAPRVVSGKNTDKLYFQHYTNKGYQIQSSRLLEIEKFNINEYEGQYDYPKVVQKTAEKSSITDYSPWPTLRPRYWFPMFYGTNESLFLGAMTSGSDALGKHIYSINAAYDRFWEITDFNVQYNIDNRWTFYYLQSHSFQSFDNSNDTDIIQSDQQYGVIRTFSSIFDSQFLSTHWGMQRKTVSNVKHKGLSKSVFLNSRFDRVDKADYFMLSYALRYDNRESYLNSPSINWGRRWDVIYDSQTSGDGEFYEGKSFQFSWQEIFDLPGRSSLSLSVLGGSQDIGAERFSLGGNKIGQDELVIGRRDFALRGYSDNAQQGQSFNIFRLNLDAFITRIERNWNFYPLGVGDISASFFIDYGSAWFDRNYHKTVSFGFLDSGLKEGSGGDGKLQVISKTSQDYLTGVGVELNAEVILGYGFLLPAKFGIAKGLDSDLGENQVYFSIGASF